MNLEFKKINPRIGAAYYIVKWGDIQIGTITRDMCGKGMVINNNLPGFKTIKNKFIDIESAFDYYVGLVTLFAKKVWVQEAVNELKES
ncbi:hypothetical protein ACOJ84_003481 [Morganella morganii]|uniref:hypothetical protein n=1 Tax=Morganella morganii TaxID=582 RepID=UPI003B889B3A